MTRSSRPKRRMSERKACSELLAGAGLALAAGIRQLLGHLFSFLTIILRNYTAPGSYNQPRADQFFLWPGEATDEVRPAHAHDEALARQRNGTASAGSPSAAARPRRRGHHRARLG